MNGHDTKRADAPRNEEDLIVEILDQLGAAVGARNPPDGHCQHCAAWCVALPPEHGSEPHESQFAQWMHGHCPTCAERERIVAAIEAHAKANKIAGYTHGLMRAAKIARGDA